MGYCLKCGIKNDDDSIFCKKCGASLKEIKKDNLRDRDQCCEEEDSRFFGL